MYQKRKTPDAEITKNHSINWYSWKRPEVKQLCNILQLMKKCQLPMTNVLYIPSQFCLTGYEWLTMHGMMPMSIFTGQMSHA